MNNAVIVVDMLNGFLKEGKLANPGARWIIPNVVDLLQRKVQENWKVIFVADNHKKDDLEFLMFPEHCVQGTEETLVVEELRKFFKSDYTYYIPKTRYSAFFRTSLESILKIINPQEIIVVGIYADICVLYTTADLRNRDYKVTIPKDCTTTLAGMDDAIFTHMKNVLGVNIVDLQKNIR
jgi:nicotinamidase/pyrazinamidase